MRQRSLRVFVMALWVSATAVLPASAQAVSDMIGRTVTAVRFDVDGQPDTSPELVALSDVHVGAPLRIEDVRATIAHLDSLGRYDNVIAEANATDGGVEVIFRLIPRHPITRMEVVGDVGISPGELRDLVQRQYGGVPTTTRPSAVEATTEQVLHDQGYLDARVTARTEVPPGSASATLVLDVTAGALAHIERTEVRGTSPLAPSDIIRRTGTRVGAVYRRRDVETAVTALEDGLRSRGYYEAQITPQATRTPTGVDVLITVDTGPRVELEVQPSGVLPGSVDELIPIKRLGSADQDLLEDSRARIERALRAQGYWKAQAPFTRTLQQDGKLLVITFTITRGPRFFIDHIELPSSLALPAATIRELIGVQPGDVFDEDRFVTGVARVVDAYRQRGFYRVEADPSYEQTSGGVDGPRATVVLRPDITEGPQGEISEVSFSFADDHQVSEAELRQIMRSRPGRPYVELDAARDRADILTLYANRGFRTADVSITPSFSNDGHSVSLTVQVNEGRQVLIGDISVVGNERVSTRAILDEMGLRPGQPAGVAALNEAQSRLVEMGVFRRVRVSVPDLAPGESEAHLIVNVVESPASSIGYGGGLEGGRQVRSAVGGGFEDYLALSPRGFFEIGRRNLGGRNRSLNLFSRVSFKPRSAPGDPMRDGRGFGFTEYRVTGTYRERRAFRTDTDLLLGVTSEQAVRTNFNFIRKSANAEVLRKLSDRLSFSGQYRLDFTRLFDERIASNDPILPLIDRLFPQVRLSILSTGISWDRRNNPIAPTRGTLATADLEVASRALGSEVGYVKTFFQVSGFRSLNESARTVLAGRVEIGAAHGFLRTVAEVDANGNPVVGPDGQPITEAVRDLPASQRFFAGGSTTVRGFQLDRLGVPEIINKDGLSLGGNGLVVLNAEIRQVAARIFGRNMAVVGFVDGGNVFATAQSIDLGRLRGSTGFGVRYDSPLGPIRLDFGFKVHPEILGGQRERRWEYHLSIGEAF